MSKATGYNWWKYSRYVYNIGRTSRQMAYSDSELAAIRSFITSILASRPEIAYKVNLKNLNSSKTYENQNFMSIGVMLQIIGRNLKLYSLSTDEKLLCDSLFESTGERKKRKISPYFTISGIVSPESSGSISGTGSYAKNSKATLVANPAEGYHFVKWEDDSTEATRIFTVSEDKTCTAIFEADTE